MKIESGKSLAYYFDYEDHLKKDHLKKDLLYEYHLEEKDIRGRKGCSVFQISPTQKGVNGKEDWSELLDDIKKLMPRISSRIAENFRINKLERDVALLNRRVSTLEEIKPIIVPIETFDPEPYEILKTFSAVIQQHEEEYVAYYFDANLSATGDTKEEAIYNLKDIIIATFDVLSSHDESELGLGPLRQIKLLKKVIRKIP